MFVDRSADTTIDDDASPRTTRVFAKSWGADYVGGGKVRFRLWAPEIASLSVRIDGHDRPMAAVGDGWFELVASGIAPGTRYRFVLPDGLAIADPAARAQDGGIDGASIVTDPTAYRWRIGDWRGLAWEQAVIYELHIGTFTEQGTFLAAIERLDYLATLGITAIELMPLAQFPGEHGWGYDGVLLYAPHHAYGTPDELKALIDAAHERGMMVFLDVVYNHFGPEGNFLHAYARSFFDAERHTPWGAAIDFSETPVRDFFIDNALYWLMEFNFDGLRLDAVHTIDDPSDQHVISELARRLRAEPGRRRHLVVEDSRNTTRFLERQDRQTEEIDAGWNDDFHHLAHIIATGEQGGYYAPFADDHRAHFAIALTEGYTKTIDEPVQLSPDRTVSTASLLPPTAFVVFLQNHDQIGNRPFGERLSVLASPESIEALTTILLLCPFVPLLFMGEEFDERRPFHFFADYQGGLADAIRAGRLREAVDSGSVPAEGGDAKVPDPTNPSTLAQSRLDWQRAASEAGQRRYELIRELLDLRRKYVTPGLAEAPGSAGTQIAHDDGVYAVEWQLGQCVWEMRANLTQRAAAMTPLGGQIIHTYPSDAKAAESIGPLTVIFAKRALT